MIVGYREPDSKSVAPLECDGDHPVILSNQTSGCFVVLHHPTIVEPTMDAKGENVQTFINIKHAQDQLQLSASVRRLITVTEQNATPR